MLDPVVAKTPDPVLFSNRAFCANEEVVANDAVDGVNVMEFAADAVVANDADITLLAQLLVPINCPVNDPLNDPVLICNEDDMSDGLLATFAYSIYDAVAIVVGLFCICV